MFRAQWLGYSCSVLPFVTIYVVPRGNRSWKRKHPIIHQRTANQRGPATGYARVVTVAMVTDIRCIIDSTTTAAGHNICITLTLLKVIICGRTTLPLSDDVVRRAWATRANLTDKNNSQAPGSTITTLLHYTTLLRRAVQPPPLWGRRQQLLMPAADTAANGSVRSPCFRRRTAHSSHCRRAHTSSSTTATTAWHRPFGSERPFPVSRRPPVSFSLVVVCFHISSVARRSQSVYHHTRSRSPVVCVSIFWIFVRTQTIIKIN